MGDLGSVPGLGRSPGERKAYPLQYSGLENSMDLIVHGVTKTQTRLSNFLNLTSYDEYYVNIFFFLLQIIVIVTLTMCWAQF